MKKDEIKKWRESTTDEINSKISEMEAQLYKLRNQLHIGQLKNFSTIKKTKRDISILNTLINEKNFTGVRENGFEKNKKG
jgi:large subunit ribosomal protein L29